MKIKNIKRQVSVLAGLFIISTVLFSCSSTHQAAKPTADEIKGMVGSGEFVFVADRMQPMRGGSKNLTTHYYVTIKKDSVNCYLPYVGRSTQAPMNMTGGGIEFKSSKSTYNVDSKKDGQWDVTIKPENNNDVQQLYFNIYSNGSANLNVTSTYRDPISFSGYVEKIKQK